MLSCHAKSYSGIPVIIYCAWPEGPEFGTSYGYVTTYQDLGTGEEMMKGLWDVGTWQVVIQEREGCCMVGNDRGDTGCKSIEKQFSLLSVSRGHFTCLDQNTVYLDNLFLAKQSSSSEMYSILFSAYLLPLQRPELGGPSNDFPSVSSLSSFSS